MPAALLAHLTLAIALQTPPTAPADAAAADAPPPEGPALSFEKGALDNGLDVIVHEDRRAPVVCVSVWYRWGALDDAAGKGGAAVIVERLLWAGTAHAPRGMHAQWLESAGASALSSSSTHDATSFLSCVPSHELELALWLESDRMAFLESAADAGAVSELREAAKRGRRRVDAERSPYAHVEEKLWQALFPVTHPYRAAGMRGAGSDADFDRVGVDEVARAYENGFAPSNATVVVAGDVVASQARQLVEKYFRTLPKWPEPTRAAIAPPALAGQVVIDVEDAAAAAGARVVVAYLTPGAFQPLGADIDVLAHILGHGNGSRLHQALVVDAALAREVSVEQLVLGNVSVLMLAATLLPGAGADDARAAFRDQIDVLKDIPPEPAEIARAVSAFEARSVFALQQPSSRAELLQRYHHYTGDAGFLTKDLARYRAVTPESIQAAVTALLAREMAAVLLVRAPGTTPPPPPPPAPADADAADGAADGGAQ